MSKATKAARKRVLVAASIAGFLAVTGAGLSGSPAYAADDACYGVNKCKGTGACGGKGHSCAGKNACAGQGWVHMDAETCISEGGSLEPIEE